MEDNMLQVQRRAFSYVGVTMFVMVILSMAMQLSGAVIAEIFLPGWRETSWLLFAVVMLPQYLIAMPVAALMLRHTPSAAIPQRQLGIKQLLVIFLICYFIMFAGSLAGTMVTSAIELVVNGEMTDFLEEMLLGSDVWAVVVSSVILAPIAEELFYRKLLIGRLGVWGERAAVFASALIFGLAHGNFSQFFYAFGLGLALGYVYIKTRRIGYTIGLHMAINLIGGVLAPLVQESSVMWMTTLFSFAMLGMVAAGLALYFINKKSIMLTPARGTQRWASPVFLNPGMILFFVISAVLFVWNTASAFM